MQWYFIFYNIRIASLALTASEQVWKVWIIWRKKKCTKIPRMMSQDKLRKVMKRAYSYVQNNGSH